MDFGPHIFAQRNLTRDEGNILEEAFWEIVFGSVGVLTVFGFLRTSILMVQSMKDYLTLDDKDDDAAFRYNYRDTAIAQFKQKLKNKIFNLQDQGKCDENDTLQKRSKFWPNVTDMGGPIPDNVFDYEDNDEKD